MNNEIEMKVYDHGGGVKERAGEEPHKPDYKAQLPEPEVSTSGGRGGGHAAGGALPSVCYTSAERLVAAECSPPVTGSPGASLTQKASALPILLLTPMQDHYQAGRTDAYVNVHIRAGRVL